MRFGWTCNLPYAFHGSLLNGARYSRFSLFWPDSFPNPFYMVITREQLRTFQCLGDGNYLSEWEHSNCWIVWTELSSSTRGMSWQGMLFDLIWVGQPNMMISESRFKKNISCWGIHLKLVQWNSLFYQVLCKRRNLIANLIEQQSVFACLPLIGLQNWIADPNLVVRQNLWLDRYPVLGRYNL